MTQASGAVTQPSGAVTQPSGVPIVEARGISKRFGHVVALHQVNLQLWPGEVLGVVGDNGAGKSTLMKCLSGLHPPSGGEILVEGKRVRLDSPAGARALGIEMVYQDLALAGTAKAGRVPLMRVVERGQCAA